MKQVFIPYWEWEDYQNGMWLKVDKECEVKMRTEAIEFTGDHIKYGNAMKEVVKAWPKTMKHNLTNIDINRRAFLGYCAVFYKLKIPEYIVRMAWKRLDNKQRYKADSVAQSVINKWEVEYESKDKEVYKRMGTQMLFEWAT